jgi:hypothetical protein
MNRETKTFTTSSGHVVEFYAYLTGKESRMLENEMLSGMKIEIAEDGKKSTSVAANTLNASQDKAMRMLIQSFDSNKDNAFDAVENLPADEYFEVVKALNPIVEAAINPAFLAKPSTPASA